MSALEIKRGRCTEFDSRGCGLCKGSGRTYCRPATYVCWVLGRPLLAVCQPCRKEAKRLWEGALDG